MWTVLYLTLLALLVSSRVWKMFRDLKSVDYLPGLRCLFSPMGLPGGALPTLSWNPGIDWSWHWRSWVYKHFKSETVSVLPYLFGSPLVYTSSSEVIRQVLTSSHLYKEHSSTRTLAMWGDNVFTTEHEAYKRHRRIVGPAFSGSILAHIWEETAKTYQEMVTDEGWLEKSVVTTECFNNYTQKVALIIIARCAFGLPLQWSTPASSKDSGLNLGKCMALVSDAVLVRSIAPRWLFKLPFKKLMEIEEAHVTLENLMRSYIASQSTQVSAEERSSKRDVFSRLVDANLAGGNLALDDDELLGNVFILLFAGHETTAKTMAATLALLAMHPEEQDIVADEIQRVLVNGRDAVFEDASALMKVQACFSEAARLFPPAFILIRDTLDHVTLTTPTDSGDKTITLAPKTTVVIDIVGACRNPRRFEDPEKFKPSRWYGSQESDLTFFGMGPRACLGRKFALTEVVCFLTLVLRDWVVTPLLRDGETIAEWRNRVFQAELGLSFGINKAPLKLTKRV